jgi:diadenosine tetraphosphatase ApaH/serine/threonine PP2A family protein phosphatase
MPRILVQQARQRFGWPEATHVVGMLAGPASRTSGTLMKLALLSDIHANLQALCACLEHAQQQGAARYAVLGDMVGYGGEPAAVMDRIMQMAQAGAVVLMGNHDAMALNPPAKVEHVGEATASWTHAQLTSAHRQFLTALPLTARLQSCFLVHASAHSPGDWQYVDDERSASVSLAAATSDPDVRYVFGGHVHHQALFYKGGGGGGLMAFSPTAGVPIPVSAHRRWIATVGSVGQPRDGQASAMYALFDLAHSRLTFHRVPYDHMAAAAAVRRAGLPEQFARRLEEGR